MTVINKLKLKLSTTEGKLKALIAATGLLLLLIIVSVGALQLTSTPAFCKSCHEMYPEYYTWANSAHSQIACVDCHIKPGPVNFVVHKVASLSQIYYHFTDTYVTPIEIKENVDNLVCEQCHNMATRVATPSGDIKFSHTAHLDDNVKCVQCHAGVVHGNIEEKGFTAMTNFDSWNTAVGKQYINSPVSDNFTKLPMQDCVTCHTHKGAPVTCDTCHAKIVKPESHQADTWLSSHGTAASKDFKACDTCHSITSKYQGDLPQDETLTDYARTNTFCNDCHAKEPAGHTASWNKDHAISAKDNGTLCLVCHNQSQRKTDAPAPVSCDTCHSMKHPDLSNHTVPIPASGYGPQCNSCHPKDVCETCHGSTGVANN